MNAREQLAKGERLGEIIVGARIKTGDAIVDGRSRRKHQDRSCVAACSQLTANFISIALRQQYVEHDERYERPTEVDALIGDYSKANRVLGWEPKVRTPELVKIMVDADIKLLDDERSGRSVGQEGGIAREEQPGFPEVAIDPFLDASAEGPERVAMRGEEGRLGLLEESPDIAPPDQFR